MDTTQKKIEMIINKISAMSEVRSIGISGGKRPFPEAGEGDIDIFIYCDCIPKEHIRQCVSEISEDKIQPSVFEGGHWGVGDLVLVNGVMTWLMYFTIQETLEEIDAILCGKRLDKEDNYYYTTGRCEMLRNIRIYYDSGGFLSSLQSKLSEYPESLSAMLINHHLEMLEDTEDLERAAARSDTLFYHFALDIAIDHFLQALFALNYTFFPSRKRSLQYISKFKSKPDCCEELLLKIIRFGGDAETIGGSYMLFKGLTKDLNLLCKR